MRHSGNNGIIAGVYTSAFIASMMLVRLSSSQTPTYEDRVGEASKYATCIFDVDRCRELKAVPQMAASADADCAVEK